MIEYVKNEFLKEFACINEKFRFYDLDIKAGMISPDLCMPGVYIFWHDNKIVKVGRYLVNSRKRALEHMNDDTHNDMFHMNSLKTCPEKCGIILINCVDKEDYHWTAAIEIYMEKVLNPIIRSKRIC